jgi:hypothetical protein
LFSFYHFITIDDMKNRISHTLAILVVFIVFFVLPGMVKASEGNIELRSTTREAYRCYAASILMQDQNYNILVSCREIIYPAGDTVFSYILWAQPTDGSAARRLGELGYGRLAAKMNIPFNSLFVTTEPSAGVRTPSGPVVMRGGVSPITFLDRATTGTPVPTLANGERPTGDVTLTPVPEEGQTTGSRLGTALRRAGLAALLALIAIIGLIFAITRSRG